MINLMLMPCTPEEAAALAAPVSAADELAAGLLSDAPSISPKFLYDALGSKLFEAICELPEYYPTRTEAGIFAAHGAAMARAAGTGTTLIDLGAGNCAKAASLFPLLQPAQYVAVDISADFVTDALNRLQQRFPDIGMLALGLDFSAELPLPGSVRTEQRLFFYPGSSIGNFSPDDALAFLQRVHGACGSDGAILIGVDLEKDHAVLDAAYDDALGVTGAFNLNILRHANTVLGSDFDVRQWRHEGFFNPALRRIEMHLTARGAQTVRWPGGSRHFAEGERIHTENSYKYREASAVDLLARAGFVDAEVWLDPNSWFAVIYARAGAGR
jgi:dimethylhistidine N-methyltransferase